MYERRDDCEASLSIIPYLVVYWSLEMLGIGDFSYCWVGSLFSG